MDYWKYEFEQDALVAELPVKSKDSLSCLYRVSYSSKKTKLLSDEIRDFCCYGRYLCYIDGGYAVHKYDRQTETDIILDGRLKAMSMNCTSAGIWIREYDERCADGDENVPENHADSLYYMDYAGEKTEI